MKISKLYDCWVPWFAWYPVWFTEYDERDHMRVAEHFVWWDYVERKAKPTGGYWYRDWEAGEHLL